MKIRGSVVIVGRMNVGKSTFFNRVSTDVKSITMDYEGVTRDFIKEDTEWRGVRFNLVDSGGIHLRKSQDPLFELIRSKVLSVIESADVIIFMVDGTVGLLPEDREIATYLHKLKKPCVLVINKSDNKKTDENLHEFDRLGFSNIIAISAEHARGIEDVLDAVVGLLPEKSLLKPEEKPSFKVMLLGKPNVGKSSLMNALLNEERAIVSEVAGTTREAFSEPITFYKEVIELIDTPGIRRKRAVEGDLEPLMVKSSFQALKKSDIILLLIDGASHTLVDQELKLAFYGFTEHYKAFILLINKEDLMTETGKLDLERCFEEYEHFLKKVPILNISCKTGKNIGRIMPLVSKVWKKYSFEFDNSKINRLFVSSLAKKPLFHNKEHLRVYEVRQVRTAPIVIQMIVNEPDWFEQSQLGFFENILRAEYDLVGAPVKIVVRKHKDKF
ncbi:ribosome biogenesis GTPase Der [Candidatus Dependentiae bacterium]|nr:ribosome biogenesis GTPase Der [Candidatus Dependentiae bacterium]